MTDTNSLIERIYEEAYKQGWKDKRSQTSYIGKGLKSPPVICHPQNDDWEKELENEIDTGDVYLVKEYSAGSQYGNDIWFLHHTEHNEDEYYSIEHQIGKELDINAHRSLNVVENIAEYVKNIKEHISTVQQENDALRATHPGSMESDSGLPKDSPSVPDDTGSLWKLDANPDQSSRRVPLSGSHVFDYVEIEYDVEVRNKKGSLGSVDVYINIANVELVSSN